MAFSLSGLRPGLTEAAADGEGFAGHPLGVVGGEEDDAGADVIRLADAAQGGDSGQGLAGTDQGVSTKPGLMELTRMPRAPSSLARVRVMESRAALVPL